MLTGSPSVDSSAAYKCESTFNSKLSGSEAYYVGGAAFANSTQEWYAALVDEDSNVAPITNGMEVEILSNLLSKDYFPSDANIDRKKDMLAKALAGYCDYVVANGGICVPNPVDIPGYVKKTDLEGGPIGFQALEVVADYKVYRFGGFTGYSIFSGYLPTAAGDRYDAQTGKWDGSVVDLPIKIAGHGGCLHNNIIYIFGGTDGGEVYYKSVFKYDILKNAVGNVNSDMLVEIYNVKVAPIKQNDGVTAIFYGGSAGTDWLYKFDPVSKKHSQHMSLPLSTNPFMCLVPSNSGADLFAIFANALVKIDVNTKAYTKVSLYTGPSLTDSSAISCAVTEKDVFYVIDGKNKLVHSLDLAHVADDDVWYKAAVIPSTQHMGLSSALVHDNLIVSSNSKTDYIALGQTLAVAAGDKDTGK